MPVLKAFSSNHYDETRESYAAEFSLDFRSKDCKDEVEPELPSIVIRNSFGKRLRSFFLLS